MYTTGICNGDSVFHETTTRFVLRRCISGLQSVPVLTAEGRGRSEVGPCQGHLALGLVFSRVCWIPFQFHSTNAQCFIVILLLSEGQAGEEWEIFQAKQSTAAFIYTYAVDQQTHTGNICFDIYY